MAGQGLQNTNNVKTESFSKGLTKDPDNILHPESSWTHARNAVNNSKRGEVGVIGNEPSNLNCINAPYTITGFVHLFADYWVVFSTDNTNSEVGLFEETKCEYRTIVNDPCLNFSTSNLISGQSKENFDCTWQIYWDDGNNPSRTFNIGDPEEWNSMFTLDKYVSNNYYQDNKLWPGVNWKETCTVVNDCKECTQINEVDCEDIRLARYIEYPCIKLSESKNPGLLLNGSYQVAMAYTINQQRVSDYFIAAPIQPLFKHEDFSSSLDIHITDLDADFDQFELIVISTVNNQKTSFRIGYYSTETSRINIDRITKELVSVSDLELYTKNKVYDKSKSMFRLDDTLIRTCPTTKFDFNYQPIANNIQTEWVMAEYSEDYYKEHGNTVGYLRDEQYAFFIQWVYDTGDVSRSYHIPGRISKSSDLVTISGSDAPGELSNLTWSAYDTSTSSSASGVTEDGGIIKKKGEMGYWESTERYPDDKAEIWGDLCGKPIRHHKMPSTEKAPLFRKDGVKNYINVLGLRFKNVRPPLDNDGNAITSIVGYQILRSTREGNKSIIAKGMINNSALYYDKITKRNIYFQNYPFNQVSGDSFLTTKSTLSGANQNEAAAGVFKQSNYSQQHYTFHSPDTTFRKPFIAGSELRIYESIKGNVKGDFLPVENHPKHKIITDTAFVFGLVVGIGRALLEMVPQRKFKIEGSQNLDLTGINAAAAAAQIAAAGIWSTAYTAYKLALSPTILLTDLILTGGSATETAEDAFSIATGIAQAAGVAGNAVEIEDTAWSSLPKPLKIVQATMSITTFTAQFADETITVIKAFLKYRDYVYRVQSHCLYNEKGTIPNGQKRRSIEISRYLDDDIQDLNSQIKVNNQWRNKCVFFKTTSKLDYLTGDNSRPTLGDLGDLDLESDKDTEGGIKSFDKRRAHSFYGAIKVNIDNQYGQLRGLRQIKISDCVISKEESTSPVLFGGDTYVNRYTEKNTFFYFYNWLQNQPDGFEYNYRRVPMISYPRYWADFTKFDTSDFFGSLAGGFKKLVQDLFNINGNDGDDGGLFSDFITPSSFHNLDRKSKSAPFSFVVKNAIMYMFNSGVKDFFVESEVNVGHRDWGEFDEERFYDPFRFSDLKRLFHTNIIKKTNFNKYDYSLSRGLLNSERSVSEGLMQDSFYDPNQAELCYTTYDTRLLYSLPASDSKGNEAIEDNWFNFLPENYRDFTSPITAIKEVGKTNAMILFDRESPQLLNGSQELTLSGGTDVIIGTGSLFSDGERLQRIANSEKTFEYGSCQNKESVINTPLGVFWLSQNQGKVFSFAGGIDDISRKGMKWWFAEYLPYKLTEDFRDFDLTDNTLSGIGCRTMYDNVNEVVYFSKKDFQLRPEFKDRLEYTGDGIFRIIGRRAPIKLGDPTYFINASWTVSYDPKVQSFISFHDWHPDLSINTKDHFLTTKDNGIWKHNKRCDNYCNFYGIDYPFEVEPISTMGQQTSILKSVEYLLEVYNYADNCMDAHHVLDFNFDRAIVHNTEQISGELRLNLNPKEAASQIVNYPITNPSSIDILYSKEEHKYRFNQFWDITDDRGEFTTLRRIPWSTDPNGYIRNINQNYVNYSKSSFEHKKFRHYIHKILLTRRVSGPNKMLLKLFNNKNTISLR